ncbi:MAG: tyrosine-type recombinase/integrase [Gemmatimonadaceae bacterium]|nr:tyrosine-type recombinase/integrase [Gemmatimonadaceae bacterium]
MTAANLPALLQRFFTDRLHAQLGASSHTVASYRDTFRLLLVFASKHHHRPPSRMRVEDLDVALVGRFLDHIEKDRANTVTTRNTRLAAVRSFFRFVAFTEPACSLQCQRVLAIPTKRHERRPVEFLTEDEATALVAAPNLQTWIGRRDRALLLVATQTGLRNAEIRSLRRRDVDLGAGAHVRCTGKGRKTRCTPLRRDVAAILVSWLAERGGEGLDAPVFPSSRGGFLSADALQRLVERHVATATAACPSFATRTITPHTLRHTTAMTLLRRGVDQTVIALWLGHESTETTQIYLHADMKLKERALGRADPRGAAPTRFRPKDRLLAFLDSL